MSDKTAAVRTLRRVFTAKRVVRLVMYVFLLDLMFVFLYPFLYMLITSIKSPEDVMDVTVNWLVNQVYVHNYALSWEALQYPVTLLRTVFLVVVCTLGHLIACSLVGYGFARFRFKEKNIAFALVLLTIIVPPQTIIISSFVNYRNFDFFGVLSLLHAIIPAVPESVSLINTPWTFILPAFFGSGLRAGLFIYIFRQFFAGLPKDLEEAAMIDGCRPFKTFLRVMLPLARSAIITVLLFSFVWHWNDYYQATMYFTSNQPISVMLNQMQSLLQDAKLYNFVTNTPDEIRTYLQAGCLLTILPPLVIYIFTQRFFTESIERTGIVG